MGEIEAQGAKVNCLKSYKFILFLFLFFRATPVAYGSSQARGQIGAAAAGLDHSHMESELHLQPTRQCMATPDP